MRTTVNNNNCSISLLISTIKLYINIHKADVCEQGVRIAELEFA